MKKLIVLFILFVTSCGSSEPEMPDSFDAQTNVEAFIKGKLVSPATAEFSNFDIYEEDVSVFKVKGSVDSQNGFGAMIRSEFSCKIKFNGDNTTTINDLVMN